MEDKKICKIGDERLVGHTNRTRSGATQIFHTGNDSRDFERYRAEGGGRVGNVEMHDKPDTIRLEPPEKHYYAKLIDGEWWWVNGCAECNGMARDWMTYVECEKHDVCRTCGTARAKLVEAPWAGKQGWQCKPCMDSDRKALKHQRLAEVAAGEYDEYDYKFQDKMKCPHCGTATEPDGETPDGEQECSVCGGKYLVEADYNVTYSTTVVGERVRA